MTTKSVFFAAGILIAVASTVLYRKYNSFRKRATVPANTVEKNVEETKKEPVDSTPANLLLDDDEDLSEEESSDVHNRW